jgi:hypothetical protein
MLELIESLRDLAESEVVWACLIGKLNKPLNLPPMPTERGENQED